MNDLLPAVVAAGIVAACATGVGSLVCVGSRSWSAGQRWVLRLVLGLGLLPLLEIAAYELLGLRLRSVLPLALGCDGLALAAGQEWRWRPGSAPTAADLLLALVLAIGLLFSALSGLLGQPGFEGLDPWGHAFGAACLAEVGVLRQPDPAFPLIHYVDAYPPLYDLLLALPASLLGAVAPAVKGVAALLVAVAPLAVWLLARSLWGDEHRADDPVYALPPGQEAPQPWATKPLDQVGVEDLVFFRPYPWLLRLVGEKRVNFPVPAGLGLPLLLLCVAGIVPDRRGFLRLPWALAMCWLGVAALLTFGAPLGVRLFPWRSWLLLAPCAALVGASGAARLVAARPRWALTAGVAAVAASTLALAFDLRHAQILPQLARPAWLVVLLAAAVWAARSVTAIGERRRSLLTAVVVVCHLVVAGPVRAASLLDPAPPRVFYNRLEHRSYLELAAILPPGARAWPLSGGLRFDILTGLDLGCTPFRPAELDLARRCTVGDPPPTAELGSELAVTGYRYLVLDPSFAEIGQHRDDPQRFDLELRSLAVEPRLRTLLERHPERAGDAAFVAFELAP